MRVVRLLLQHKRGRVEAETAYPSLFAWSLGAAEAGRAVRESAIFIHVQGHHVSLSAMALLVSQLSAKE